MRWGFSLITFAPLRRFWPLGVIIAVVLFPFGWLAELWPALNLFTGSLFPSVVEHAIGHSLIFFLLGCVLLISFPQLRSRPGIYLLIMLCFALGQEAFQLAYKQRPLVFDEFRDIVTDTIGAGTAYLMVQAYLKHKRTHVKP
jgi:hypothetical protein